MARVLAVEQVAGRLQIQPHLVFASSEVLTDVTRGRAAAAYGQMAAILMLRFEEVAGNVDGRLPGMMRSVGFQSVASTVRLSTVFETLDATL